MTIIDTRSKILSPAQAEEIAQRDRVLVAAGSFDVLLATHCRQLAALRSNANPAIVLVVVTPVHDALLSARARAELVAGLAMVDYVVIADDEDFAVRLGAVRVTEHERQQLIEHVRSRHS